MSENVLYCCSSGSILASLLSQQTWRRSRISGLWYWPNIPGLHKQAYSLCTEFSPEFYTWCFAYKKQSSLSPYNLQPLSVLQSKEFSARLSPNKTWKGLDILSHCKRTTQTHVPLVEHRNNWQQHCKMRIK